MNHIRRTSITTETVNELNALLNLFLMQLMGLEEFESEGVFGMSLRVPKTEEEREAVTDRLSVAIRQLCVERTLAGRRMPDVQELADRLAEAKRELMAYKLAEAKRKDS